MPKGIYPHKPLLETTKEKLRNFMLDNPNHGQFKKGHIITETIRKKISIANMGNAATIGMTGRHHSLETIEKIKVGNRGKKPTAFCIRRGIEINTGKPLTLEHRLKIKNALKGKMPKNNAWGRKGSLNPSWEGGITSIQKKTRNSLEYKQWRISVFERDNYTCQFCLKHGVELHAHHIRPFAAFPLLRFSKENGITLCSDCHKETPSFAGKKLIYIK
jgi:hypothetical protein